MAIALTSSYKKVDEKKMGDWGYGTLYLRLYAKFNEENKIMLQSRVYNNGTVCYSYNCYATIQDEDVKENEYINFTSKKEVTLGTVTVDAETLTAEATFRCFGFGLSNTFTVSETVTLPADKATGLDFDIGGSTIITVTRYNDSNTRTVELIFGDISKTLIEKSTETQITWNPEYSGLTDSDLYKQIPDSNTGTITLKTTTYDKDNNVIGEPISTTFKCRVVDSNPVINGVEITDSLAVLANDTLIRYMSKPKLAIDASGVNESSIVSYSVTELNSAKITSDSNEIVLDNTITNNSFLVEVTDSRGNTTPATFSAEKFIEYILPAISKLDLVRTGENLDQVQANITGVWFNQSLNETSNAISLKYRYKTSTGEYSDYIDITEVPTEAQFVVETLLTPDGGFDTNSVYTIEVVATDSLTSGSLSNLIGKATPLIDHWNENDKDYYNINAEIQQYGSRIFNPQKVLWNGASYMNESQTIELSEKVSEQNNGIVLVWCRYADETAKDDSFNFTFIPKQWVTLKGGYGVTSIIAGTAFSPIGSKYVYVSDDHITGNAKNSQSSTTTNGVTYDNSKFVLRYVIGV